MITHYPNYNRLKYYLDPIVYEVMVWETGNF
jgi:hypothetical protein